MLPVSDWLKQAQKMVEAGRLPDAEAEFRRILQAYPYQAEAYSDWGIALHGLGRLPDAERAFRQALQLNPNLSNVYSNLGVCLQGRGAHDEALQMHLHSVRLDPNFAAGYLNLGNTYSELKKFPEALDAHQKAVALNPRVSNGYTNMGNTLMELGRKEEALAAHEQAIVYEPHSATAWLNLGNTYHTLNRFADAEKAHRKSIELDPNLAAAHSNLANTLVELNKVEEAKASCLKAIELNPNFRNAHMNLGNVYRRLNKLDEAEFHHRKTLDIDPKFADGWLNLGNTLYAAGKFSEGLASYRHALTLQPHFPSCYSNIGMTLTQMEHFDEAFQNYEKAIEQQSDCVEARWNRGWTNLLLGKWHEGWKDYDWRFKLKVWDKKFSKKPLWDGQPLEGKTILLGREQGIGDTLMMLRFVRVLKNQGARVIVQAAPFLHKLLQFVPGIDELCTEAEPWPEHDYFAPIMSLLVRFQATAEYIPGEVPYVLPPAELVEAWKQNLSQVDGFRIGIAWQGSPTFTSDRWRSCPLKEFLPLTAIPGVRIISLQKNVGTEQLNAIRGQVPIVELTEDIDRSRGSFVDTAAIMKNLDLIVSTDTAIPHLAGALGVPVWMVLGRVPDWRWLKDAEHSPLYPTMRIFRQTIRDQWGDVFANVVLEIKKLLEKKDPFERLREEIAKKPDDVGLHFQLSIRLHQAERYEEAVVEHREVLRLDPKHLDASNNLGVSLQAAGDIPGALVAYRRALEISPNNPLLLRNLGVCLKGAGEFEEAIRVLRLLLSIDPNQVEGHWTLAYCLLIQGFLEEGWKENEWRLLLPGKVPYWSDRPRWQGEDLAGKTLLVHCEQGYGDMIQFARYLKQIKDTGATTIVRGPVRLLPLLRQIPGIDVPYADDRALPPHDYQIAIMSFPTVLRTTLESIPREVPYLHIPPELVEFWRDRLEALDGFRIAIAWQGSTTFPDDKFRSIPLVQFAPLAAIPGVRLISLQRGPGVEQIEGIDFHVEQLSGDIDGSRGAFLDTAAILHHVDLVIASDSALIHLAGALNRPAWMPTGALPDWRWLLERDDCPWYPSLRLFRQKVRGEWAETFERVAGALRERLKSANRRPVMVAIAPGELVDKITILEIKAEHLADEAKKRNVRYELELLNDVRERRLAKSDELSRLTDELKVVNAELWRIEDDIRACERERDFGAKFVELARAVYKTNDRRASLKRQINELLESAILEEKSYAAY